MTEKIAFKSWAKQLAKKREKSVFKMHFVTTSKNMRQIPKPFLERFFLVVFKNGIKNYSTWSDD